MIHLRDGSTLTDADVYPHEVDSELITSVERVVSGRTITIKKSPLIDTFFVGTEASADFRVLGRSGKGSTAQTTKRILGCYVKDSEPPIQCQFSMDPRTRNTIVEFFEVRGKAREGIRASRIERKGHVVEVFQRQFADEFHGIIKSSLIEETFETPTGLGCTLVKPRIRAEILVQGSNVLLVFGQPGEKLSLG
jgi:hypothetical protein